MNQGDKVSVNESKEQLLIEKETSLQEIPRYIVKSIQ